MICNFYWNYLERRESNNLSTALLRYPYGTESELLSKKWNSKREEIQYKHKDLSQENLVMGAEPGW